MSLFKFKRKPGSVVRKEMVVGLTPLGQQKAEKFELSGVKFDVLATLSERGPSTIDEVAQETRLNDTKATVIVKELIKSGYVQTVKASG